MVLVWGLDTEETGGNYICNCWPSREFIYPNIVFNTVSLVECSTINLLWLARGVCGVTKNYVFHTDKAIWIIFFTPPHPNNRALANGTLLKLLCPGRSCSVRVCGALLFCALLCSSVWRFTEGETCTVLASNFFHPVFIQCCGMWSLHHFHLSGQTCYSSTQLS